jgi:hypothetical protein
VAVRRSAGSVNMLGVLIDQGAEVAALRTELAELRELVVELAGPVVLADGRIAEVELRRQLCTEAYKRGLAAGYRTGYIQAVTDWKVTAGDMSLGGPTFAELDRRRYPPGGRVSWLLPKLGDDTPDIPRPRGAA